MIHDCGQSKPKRNDACKRLEFGDVVAHEFSPPENEVGKKMLGDLQQMARKTHNKLKVDKQDTALLRSVQQNASNAWQYIHGK